MTDFARQYRPGVPVTESTEKLEVLTVSLPPGSSIATTNSELNGAYSEAQANLAKAQASGDQAAITRATIIVNERKTRLNNFIKGQNDTTRSTLDEKNYNAPNANAIATTTTTQTNTDDAATAANSTTQTATVTTIKLEPFDNILHEYSNYTYRFSLYVLGTTEYNDIINDAERKVDDVKNLLMASGGFSSGQRSPYFKEDFYFDSMEITTLFGSGATTRNTNAVTTKFKVIEPYGITYLERLTKAVSELTESNNYTDQPYLLTLDFWGYDDEALAPKKIEGCTRHLFLRIVNVTFQITSKGTEYEFTAMPYGHYAFNQEVGSFRSNFEVSAKTVGEFFGDSLGALNTIANINKNVAELPPREDNSLMGGLMRNASADRRARNTRTAVNTGELKNSLSYVMNQDEQQKKIDLAIDIPDEYVFVIDKSIADANILATDDKDIKGIPMKTELYKKFATAASKTTITVDNDKRKIAVSSGTSLINLINDIVIHSTYALDQIIAADDEEAKNTKAEKPIDWFRIIPDVEIIGFDKKLNRYAKRYTYNILPFSVFGHNHEQMPQGPAPGVSKIYDYFYTGQNKDILDLKIEYNALYMQVMTANKDIKAGSTPPANIDKNPDKTDTTNPAGTVFPSQVTVSNTPAISSAQRASTNSNDLILNDVSNSLLNKPGTDMVSVNMTIVGDPAYIVQADVFYGKQTGQFFENSILPDRSLNPCITDIFALIRFNTPNDIDLDNGIYDFTDNGDKGITSSAFTGLYRVIQIENNFSGGKFTQILHLLRAPNQSTDYVIESAAKAKFTKQDVSPENIKKLIEGKNKIFGGVASDLLDLASSMAPVNNLLSGRNLV